LRFGKDLSPNTRRTLIALGIKTDASGSESDSKLGVFTNLIQAFRRLGPWAIQKLGSFVLRTNPDLSEGYKEIRFSIGQNSWRPTQVRS
jgi:hypothetical protein